MAASLGRGPSKATTYSGGSELRLAHPSAAQGSERRIDDLETVEGTAHVSSQNGAHRLLSGERGISRLARLGRFGHVALRMSEARRTAV